MVPEYKLLIVDDEPGMLRGLKSKFDQALKRDSAQVLASPDYVTGLGLINENIENGSQISLVLGDVAVGPPNLWSFMTMLTENNIAIPVVAMSGYALKIDPDYYKPGGPRIVATYTKPLDVDRMVREVRSLLLR